MKRLLVSMTAVAVALLATAVVAQSGSELLSQALSKERTEGKLSEAIVLYQRIASDFAADHALAAKALVQMGHAYEKLGKSDARKAYDRVVREYADQRELAAEAGARIAALDRALAPAPAKGAASGLVARQVWTGPDVDPLGSISPDGTFMSVTQPTGDLAVRDMATGEKRYLTRKGNGDESPEVARYSVVSPDASQIAYAWSARDRVDELRVIPRDGGQPRVIYRNDQIQELHPHAWSPDGRTLAVALSRRDRTTQLALVSVADGSVRVLKSLDWRAPGAMAFSPDGRYLAYDFPPVETAPERDIYVIAVDGSREAAVVTHPANDVLLGWFPAGQTLLFASDRTGTNSLWSIRMESGRPQGEPKLLKENIGRWARGGFTRAGDFYYGLPTSIYDVYTTTLDPSTGKAVKAPARLEDRHQGSKMAAMWSADGTRLAYAEASHVNLDEPWTVSIQSSTGGQAHAQSFRVPLSYVTHYHLAWLNDGSALVIPGTDLKGRRGLFRFTLSTGEVDTFALDIIARHPAVSPDGRTLFYEWLSTVWQQFGVVARDLVSGDERVVYPHGVRELALSPDGESLAIVTESHAADPTAATPGIRIMPSRGGPDKEIYTFESPAAAQIARRAEASLAWAPDGKSLLFITPSHTSDDEVWRVSVDGGPAEKVGVALPRIERLSLHPDGRQLIMSAGRATAEYWVMQNLGSSTGR